MYRGSPDLVYLLDGSPDRKVFNLGLYTPRRYRNSTISVPRGGHMGHVLLARNFTDKTPCAAEILDLPPGVTAQLGEFRRDTPYVPVILSAASDAPLGGAMTRPKAKGKTAPFVHFHTITRGRNDSGYINETMTSLPVAVAEPPPFSLAIEPVRAPIVAGSYLPLRVRITRSKGFTSAVQVRMLWNPPGLSSGTVTLSGKKTEGTLYISARGDARPSRWPIAIVGSGRVRRVTQEASSSMTHLQVEAPWITAAPGKARTARGSEVDLTAKLTWPRDVQGTVVAYLSNLPKGARSKSITLDPGAPSVTFPITVDAKTPVGRHRPVVRFKVKIAGGAEAIHQNYGAELRVDRPVTAAQPDAGGGE